MNQISMEQKKQILNILIEGNSIRSTERLTGVHRDTIMRLLVNIGNKCKSLLDKYTSDFHCQTLQADEIWCYVAKKEKTLKRSEKYDSSQGDQYVYIALDADSKFVPLFTVGKRNQETTETFMSELSKKLQNNGRIQLTTDGLLSYIPAVENAFGGEIDFAQLIKVYGKDQDDEQRRYSPPKIKEIISRVINGFPNVSKISTSYIERQNLTIRMQLRRFTRLTNAFSKKLENLKAALALHFVHYNFIRIHSSIRVTPAIQAGITDHIWQWEDILNYNL